MITPDMANPVIERTLRVEYLPLAELQPAKTNPKKHNLELLQESLLRFGFVSPVILDEASQTVLAGHGRLEALKQLCQTYDTPPEGVKVSDGGAWLVPVLRGVEFEQPSEAVSYLLADNRLCEVGGWDAEVLAETLAELEDEALGLGWDEKEMEKLLATLDEDSQALDDAAGEDEADEEETPSPPASNLKPSERVPKLYKSAKLHHGDCLKILNKLRPNTVDALVCDPPAGIGFISEAWDSGFKNKEEWVGLLTQVFSACLKVMKPGAHGLVWAFPRTAHWTSHALEQAGFEVRDVLIHLLRPPSPKSVNLSKAAKAKNVDAPELDGLGTGVLKAAEHWVLVRKPLEGTTVENVLKWGTGGLDLRGCAIPREKGQETWPKTVTWEHAEDCSETECSPTCPSQDLQESGLVGEGVDPRGFFYCPPVSTAEREAGCEGLDFSSYETISKRKPSAKKHARSGGRFALSGEVRNIHPSVKSIALMRWLVRMVTCGDFMVLDPFMGSGATGIAALREGCKFIGIEKEERYFRIAEARIKHWADRSDSF